MPRRNKQKMNLATAFQAVSSNLVEHRASLNQADSYNHDHGDNMVEIFGVINEAMDAKRGKKPADQLAYASQLLEQRSQSGSAKVYASGLSQASRQIKGKAGASPWNAFYIDAAPVLLNDAVNLRQSQSGALPDCLGGKERVIDARQDFFRNPRS